MRQTFLYPAIWPEGVRTESIGGHREGSQGFCEMLEGEVSLFWAHPPPTMLFSELDSLRMGIGSSLGQTNRGESCPSGYWLFWQMSLVGKWRQFGVKISLRTNSKQSHGVFKEFIQNLSGCICPLPCLSRHLADLALGW